MYFKFLFILLLLLLCLPLKGQQNDTYTDLLSTYFSNPATINPAYVPPEGKASLIASYKNRIGPLHKIATYSFTAERIFRKENRQAHVGRIMFWNEKEGPFFHKPRAYINYAYELPVSENTHLSSGLALGFAQIAFSAPSATGAGKATVPDGTLGFMLSRKKISVGVSSMQLFNTGAKAISATLRLRRFYNFFLAAEKDFNDQWQIKAYALGRLLPSGNNNAELSVLLTYHQTFSIGSSVRYKQGLSFFAIFNINVGKDRMVISLAYNSPAFNKSNLLESAEITSGYLVR